MKKKKSILSFLFMGIILFSIGCNNSKEAVTNSEAMDKSNDDIIKMPDLSTVDYYAAADDSSWIFTVAYGQEITFIDKRNNIEYHSDTNEKQLAGGADIVSIYSKGKTYLISANIGIEDCKGNGKHVNIYVQRIKDKKDFDYSGCGFYHGSPRLNDIWVLESINGDTLSAEQFPKEFPHLEFNLNTQRMSGFAGCNQVNGNLKFDYNKIIIEPLVSTRMYCKETSPLEKEILNILRSKPIYNFYDLHLYIETAEGSLKFRKVD